MSIYVHADPVTVCAKKSPERQQKLRKHTQKICSVCDSCFLWLLIKFEVFKQSLWLENNNHAAAKRP